MLKKLVAAVLATTMVIGVCSPISAADEHVISEETAELIHEENIKLQTGEYASELITKTLHDLSGNEFDLIETGDIGYYIFDSESGKYMEQAPNSPSPYLDEYDNLYYFGPMNYYKKVGNQFEHTLFPEKYSFSVGDSAEIQAAFDQGVSRLRETKDAEVLALLSQDGVGADAVRASFDRRSTTTIYIPGFTHIQNATFPENENGTCGYTAACIVLYYWHKMKPPVVNSTFLDSNGKLKKDGYTLQDKLLSYGYSTDTWAATICQVLIDYCDEYGVDGESTFTLLMLGIDTELNANRPVILFGLLPEDPDTMDGYAMHAVVAYGLSTNTSTGDTDFVVHYGWENYENVILEKSLIGSYTKFEVA